MSPTPAKSIERVVLEGRYIRLEPVEQRHASELFAVSYTPDASARYQWLPSNPPETEDAVAQWIKHANAGDDIYYAVIDKSTGKAVGRQGWMRTRPEHGSVEIGGIYWGLPMARSRLSTEALFLFAQHAFDDLGYRRFEWKCNNRNEPSKAAAQRFGFLYEGLFRNDMIVKGESRDTAWFSIIDSEWPVIRAEFERWLDPGNFDDLGQQKSKLVTRR
ncbi:GNAT family protein [Devosia sp. MC521]|uniref:GNAT family N-acetyltransferase n=1 Tax=Devosia sp. MC521 TaxID=2759954 RepID=UPI0015F82DB5|nr:GNAT family protein [Devosia sp. MC521]MBJ6987166.1 GNAT family N-acetyltransferase [Devosia sp. MC521]QMW62781.1 GNAT family N-acetyltransferase [Devosia sp. MC521]